MQASVVAAAGDGCRLLWWLGYELPGVGFPPFWVWPLVVLGSLGLAVSAPLVVLTPSARLGGLGWPCSPGARPPAPASSAAPFCSAWFTPREAGMSRQRRPDRVAPQVCGTRPPPGPTTHTLKGDTLGCPACPRVPQLLWLTSPRCPFWLLVAHTLHPLDRPGLWSPSGSLSAPRGHPLVVAPGCHPQGSALSLGSRPAVAPCPLSHPAAVTFLATAISPRSTPSHHDPVSRHLPRPVHPDRPTHPN